MGRYHQPEIIKYGRLALGLPGIPDETELSGQKLSNITSLREKP